MLCYELAVKRREMFHSKREKELFSLYVHFPQNMAPH